MSDFERFSKNLKLMLEEKGLTQSEFARLCEVGKSTVTNWVRGYGEPTVTYICRILRVLGCTYEELIS